MPAAPASAARRASATEWAVSLVPVPATTGTLAASTTARTRMANSSSVRTGASPVVPATTRPSAPLSDCQRARRAAPSTSSRPSSSNGVTMAVTMAPNGADADMGSGYRLSPRRAVFSPAPLRDCVPGGRSPARWRRAGASGGDGGLSGGLEAVVLLARVGPVLERDHAQLRELRPQPAVGAVEQPELLAIGDDLREEHGLEHLSLRHLQQQRRDDPGVDAHAVPHLLLEEAVAHAHGGLEGELLAL